MRMCFFGDSFTQGTGDDDCLGWVGRVGSGLRKQGHDVTLYNLGVRRDTSGDILARWESEASARLPAECSAQLVFSFGSNDAAPSEVNEASRLTLSQTITNARSILAMAQKQAPTFLIGPLPVFQDPAYNARIKAISDGLAHLCASIDVPYLDLTCLPDACWHDWKIEAQAGDGVHPNSKGYESLAKVISEWQPLASSIEGIC